MGAFGDRSPEIEVISLSIPAKSLTLSEHFRQIWRSQKSWWITDKPEAIHLDEKRLLGNLASRWSGTEFAGGQLYGMPTIQTSE
jgi:hypothetical protein